jgi:hypothetical protein
MTDDEAKAFAEEFGAVDEAELGARLQQWVADNHPEGVAQWLVSLAQATDAESR